MDHKRLKEILAAFADDPTTLHFERNEIIVQIQQEVISARLKTDGGILYVEENGVTQQAAEWVATRIAQLDQLAHNIQQYIQKSSDFIDAPAELLDQLSNAKSDAPVRTVESLKTLRDVLDRRPAGVCSIQYLTSDAGEGKTTLINQLAFEQAEAYRRRTSKWLLVPISLGGNPFLRLDNIIAAGLVNQLRVRRFFYEGFMQLVRLGFIVLALDGFEEVFIETAGDAVSSLGNLIRDLQGEGTVLIAARTAYFDFRRLDQQARLYDSLPSVEVGFAKLALNRWNEEQFLQMCKVSNLNNGHDIYVAMRTILPEDHPLLTRAVFVRRLMGLAVDGTLDFLQKASNVNDLFYPFVDSILHREIYYKWIDNSSGAAIPLLSSEDHHDLLGLIAEEMLLNKRTALPISACQEYADIFCEAREKSPTVARQVRERITSHALLLADATKTQIAFDHDHFREFFLGELLAKYLIASSENDIRKLLRIEPLGGFCLDTTLSVCIVRDLRAVDLVARLQKVAETEGPSSFVRENCGGLIVRALNRYEAHEGTVVCDLTLPANSLTRKLAQVSFKNCYFQSTSFCQSSVGVRFEKCDFEWIELEKNERYVGFMMEDCKVQAVTSSLDDETNRESFDPHVINSLLENHGIQTGRVRDLSINEDAVEDWQMAFVRKVMIVFARSTVVGDQVLIQKFGAGLSDFETHILPQLLERRIMVEVPNRGGGSQRRFKLGRPLAQLSQLLSFAQGSFHDFLYPDTSLGD